MKVDYVYCSACGYEGHDVFVAYSRTCASGDICICPECKSETLNIEVEETS